MKIPPFYTPYTNYIIDHVKPQLPPISGTAAARLQSLALRLKTVSTALLRRNIVGAALFNTRRTLLALVAKG